jgi:hypothetical protein
METSMSAGGRSGTQLSLLKHLQDVYLKQVEENFKKLGFNPDTVSCSTSEQNEALQHFIDFAEEYLRSNPPQTSWAGPVGPGFTLANQVNVTLLNRVVDTGKVNHGGSLAITGTGAGTGDNFGKLP